MQLSLYASTFDEQMNLKNKITRVIETAMTDISTTGTPQMEPGIALMGLFDKLRTTDYKTYFSDQNNWLASPSPVIYRNGAVISTGFTIDRPNGKIVFGSAQPTTDDIRADYKVGYLDFIISSINDLPITDIANVTHKFNSFFTLDTFIYVRTKGQKLL